MMVGSYSRLVDLLRVACSSTLRTALRGDGGYGASYHSTGSRGTDSGSKTIESTSKVRGFSLLIVIAQTTNCFGIALQSLHDRIISTTATSETPTL